MRSLNKVWRAVRRVAVVGALAGALAPDTSGQQAPDTAPEMSAENSPPWLTGADKAQADELTKTIKKLRGKADYVEAIPLAQQLLELRESHQGPDWCETRDARRLVDSLTLIAGMAEKDRRALARADSMTDKIERYYNKGEYAKALEETRKQLEPRARLLPARHEDLFETKIDLAASLTMNGDLAQGEALYVENLPEMRAFYGGDNADLASTVSGYGNMLRESGRLDKAEPLLSESLEMARRTMPPEDFRLPGVFNNWAALLADQGNYKQASAVSRQAVDGARKFPEHPEIVVLALTNFGALLTRLGDYSGAQESLEEAYKLARKELPGKHPYRTHAKTALAAVLIQLGEHERAQKLLEEK